MRRLLGGRGIWWLKSVIPACPGSFRKKKDSRQAGMTQSVDLVRSYAKIFLIFCTLVLLLPSVILSLSKDAYAFKLPATGQTKCYQAVSPYAEIPCAGTGQDGAYIINPMSYTDNGNGTVTDNNTGLMWQKQDDGSTYNWYQASGTYDSTYNSTSKNICGELRTGAYSDWRLPSKKELITIVDYSIPYPGPTINPVFTNTHASNYWSSTTGAYDPSNAWYVNFYYGSVSYYSKYNTIYVRCVRGGQ